MILENGADLVNIDIPVADEKEWFITKSQKISITKDAFMLRAFNEDFPQFSVKDFSDLVSLVSRSVALQDWFALQSANFIRTIELPGFLSDVVKPEKYNSIKESLSSYNKALAEEGKQIKALSEKFDEDLKRIKNNTSKVVSSILSDPIVRVLTMKTSEMPISLQIKINNYTPKTDDVTQSRDRYAQEMLFSYQRSLVKLIGDKPNVNIDSVINGLSLK